MLVETHVWHVRIDPQHERFQFLQVYSLKAILVHYGFTVEPLSEQSRAVTARHTDAHAMTMLILKGQLPKGVIVDAVV